MTVWEWLFVVVVGLIVLAYTVGWFYLAWMFERDARESARRWAAFERQRLERKWL